MYIKQIRNGKANLRRFYEQSKEISLKIRDKLKINKRLSYRIKSSSDNRRKISFFKSRSNSLNKERTVESERKSLKGSKHKKITYFTRGNGFFYSKKKQEIESNKQQDSLTYDVNPKVKKRIYFKLKGFLNPYKQFKKTKWNTKFSSFLNKHKEAREKNNYLDVGDSFIIQKIQSN